ncbi:S8 family serine peptidase [Deinococcus puniceus]|uniref:Serine protease n=1 Tax=Deinococcus puniceus TaxID=1182568 RepID=A0A172T934_9DEIO|nr:S8 family serine peptidase [Deinococcus puniceus]ANE43454.1 serine protease [Deinococcus puniceus]
MNHSAPLRLPLAALLTLSLMACTPDPAPVVPPVVPPPVVIAPPQPPVTPAPGPSRLSNQTVNLGTALSGTATQSFSGTWNVRNVPDWLAVSATAGSGDVNLTVTADRVQMAALAANVPTLSGDLILSWAAGTASGTVTWRVTADNYTLTGRVVDGAAAQSLSVSGADLQAGATAVENPAVTEARGVIVKYRAATAHNAVLDGKTLNAQPLGAQLSTAQLQGLQRSTDVLNQLGISPAQRRNLGGREVLLQTEKISPALAALRADPNVEYAVPNAVLRQQATPVMPSDQYAGLQWAYPLMGYGAVWRDMEGGAYTRPVTVAVIDSGVRFDHPDLAGQLWQPGEGALDVLSDAGNGDGNGVDSDPTDPSTPERVQNRTVDSHGTHVTGIIAARWGTIAPVGCPACSTSGVVGASYLAPIKVLPIRAIDVNGDITLADVTLSVRYAAGLRVPAITTNPHPAQVINLSLGGEISADDAAPMCDAIAEARTAGALVVAAGGNGGSTVPTYPAACSAAVSVASVSLSGASAPTHAPYSSAYDAVQLSAPGGTDPNSPTAFNGGTFNGAAFPDMILSTGWDYGRNQPAYMAEVGTSQAAPQVAALAALLLSKGVTSTPADTLARLNATATDLGAAGRDPKFGFGMINAAAALNAPATSSGVGLRLQDSLGNSYQPVLDSLGRFTALLPNGTFRVVAGRDLNSNGVYGEVDEAKQERSVNLGPSTPSTDVGTLTVGN